MSQMLFLSVDTSHMYLLVYKVFKKFSLCTPTENL